ncbi:ribulose bisphosphate carboxylase small subunit [Rhizobium leguminosarum]|uniref:ribulose bisphosphate carboxylase small subunit n=1 Tax=Rhizobium leguminosarum TaxID=384 RepID=UPI001AE3DE9D|nr:ribulose bisphosphate carboxylase small subunit [Rhizobium leguminosarum]MBP2448297.1 ribulose bisphosphate carboxylase small subunit [Rhizobium leguminosarum]
MWRAGGGYFSTKARRFTAWSRENGSPSFGMGRWFITESGNPMFDLRDAKGVMMELADCHKANPDHYIRINAFDNTRGWETVRTSFIANRPDVEPRLDMARFDTRGRSQLYGWKAAR